MLEYSGVNTGLITTKGFRDVLEMRRGYKESLFDISLPPPHPIVPRGRRLGVSERIDYAGKIVVPLDEREVYEAVQRLRQEGVESIAVCFLFSFVNPVHEQRVREIARDIDPRLFVTLSSEVLPQVREFERVSTTVVNAYTSPKLAKYLDGLTAKLAELKFGGSLFLMQSNGGMMDVAFARDRGVEAILSGPSGGVVAASHIGGLSGHKNLITADMGGTSYDVCLIENSRPEIGVDSWIARYRIAVPLIDIHTIGAGGGSIAWIDDGGALRVGPRSAGSSPGPACYGRGGTEPTVTDADVVLGYLDPEHFLGGRMKLDRGAAVAALAARVARPLGIDVEDAAVGIYEIANGSMINAIRYVSVARGRDPADFALLAFGGAGPVHAGTQVRDLGVRTILVPKNASVLSALGNLIADFKVSKIQSYFSRSDGVNMDELNAIFARLHDEAKAQLSDGTRVREISVRRFIDIHYEGQVQEVTVAVRARTRRLTEVSLAQTLEEFHELHERLYKFKKPEQPTEIVSLRLDMVGVRDPVRLTSQPFEDEDAQPALKGMRRAYFGSHGFLDARIYDGERVRPGNLITGPAIIEEPNTSIVLQVGQEAMLDQFSTYVIQVAR
jgi:N-methylhydantoinase A